jgi:hypothetical protein
LNTIVVLAAILFGHVASFSNMAAKDGGFSRFEVRALRLCFCFYK